MRWFALALVFAASTAHAGEWPDTVGNSRWSDTLPTLEGAASGAIDMNGYAIGDSTEALNIGSLCVPTTMADATGNMVVCGLASFEGTAYFEGQITAVGPIVLSADQTIYSNTGTGSSINLRNTDQTVQSGTVMSGSTANHTLFVQRGDMNFDFAHAQSTNHTLFGHSNNQATDEFWGRTHDATDSVYETGKGDHRFNDDGGKGVASYIRTKTEAVTFANDAAKATVGSIIPDGATIVGVSGRVTTILAGCASVDVGDGVDQDLFAAALALAEGSTFTNADVTAAFTTMATGSTPATAAGEITVTANGGNCTSGVVSLTVHYTDVTAATSS